MKYLESKHKFLELLPSYLGHSGLLSQKDLDQGDTSQRVGTMFTLLVLLEDQDLIDSVMKIIPAYGNSMDLLKASYGKYFRSPNPAYWGHDARNMSRDQLSILKQAMAAMNDKPRLLSVLVKQVLRLGFHQNYYEADENRYHIPDIMSPNEVSVYARGLLGWLSYPITMILDFSFLADIYLKVTKKSPVWDTDNMLAQNLLFACHRYPTHVAKYAMKKYLKTDFMFGLRNYHANPTYNMCEPLYHLFVMAFLKLERYSE